MDDKYQVKKLMRYIQEYPMELLEDLVCENPFLFTKAIKKLEMPKDRDILIDMFQMVSNETEFFSGQVAIIKKLINDEESFTFLSSLLDQNLSPIIHNLIWGGFTSKQLSRLSITGDTDAIRKYAGKLVTDKEGLVEVVKVDSKLKPKKKKTKMV